MSKLVRIKLDFPQKLDGELNQGVVEHLFEPADLSQNFDHHFSLHIANKELATKDLHQQR